MKRALSIVAIALATACTPKLTGAPSTCASVEVLHPGVEVQGTVGAGAIVRAGRVEVAGRVRTAPEGRAIVRREQAQGRPAYALSDYSILGDD